MTDNLLKEIGTFVKEKREVVGISQSDLAESVYGNKNRKSCISRIESGSKKGLTVESLSKILTKLNSGIAFTE